MNETIQGNNAAPASGLRLPVVALRPALSRYRLVPEPMRSLIARAVREAFESIIAVRYSIEMRFRVAVGSGR